MAELNARNESLCLNQGVAVASVMNTHFVDAEGVGHYQVGTIGRGATLLFHEETVVGVQTNELELHII